MVTVVRKTRRLQRMRPRTMIKPASMSTVTRRRMPTGFARDTIAPQHLAVGTHIVARARTSLFTLTTLTIRIRITTLGLNRTKSRARRCTPSSRSWSRRYQVRSPRIQMPARSGLGHAKAKRAMGYLLRAHRIAIPWMFHRSPRSHRHRPVLHRAPRPR